MAYYREEYVVWVKCPDSHGTRGLPSSSPLHSPKGLTLQRPFSSTVNLKATTLNRVYTQMSYNQDTLETFTP